MSERARRILDVCYFANAPRVSPKTETPRVVKTRGVEHLEVSDG